MKFCGANLLETHSRVMIVNRSAEVRMVLRTALERRGIEIVEASAADQGLAIAQTSHPDLVVVDIEELPTEPDVAAKQFQSDSSEPTYFVFLGSAKRDQPKIPCSSFVTKPYHYQPLVSTIERMLVERRAA
jgi:DNA-binding NtrC family response regulator